MHFYRDSNVRQPPPSTSTSPRGSIVPVPSPSKRFSSPSLGINSTLNTPCIQYMSQISPSSSFLKTAFKEQAGYSLAMWGERVRKGQKYPFSLLRAGGWEEAKRNSSSMGMAGAALTPQPRLPAHSCIGLASTAGAQLSMTEPLHPLRQR